MRVPKIFQTLNIYYIYSTLALVQLGIALYPGEKSYDGSKVFRIHLGDDPQDVAAIKGVVANLKLDTWTDSIVKNFPVDVEVPSEKLYAFTKVISDRHLKVSVMHEDLGASIRVENQNPHGQYSAQVEEDFFNNYHSYADHLQFMTHLAELHPKNAEVIVAGYSGQGHPITGIHIYGRAGKGKRPAVIFHGTVHAREWITTMTTQYFAWSLLGNHTTNPRIEAYVDKYDFYIFPVVNPDGFVYSQTVDRLWRKNRDSTSGSNCTGTDINRNWAWKWDVPGGASTDPCDETYKGQTPGDTAEFKVLSAFMDRLTSSNAGVKLYIDWHSYSQLFMTPYGYSCSAVTTDGSELGQLAAGYAKAASALFQTTYKSGPVCTTVYQVTGCALDYAYDVSKIKYAFTTELRDHGQLGFILPAQEILPTAKENWAGVAYLLENIK